MNEQVYREALEMVQNVVDARDHGDFSPILPKLREILKVLDSDEVQ